MYQLFNKNKTLRFNTIKLLYVQGTAKVAPKIVNN